MKSKGPKMAYIGGFMRNQDMSLLARGQQGQSSIVGSDFHNDQLVKAQNMNKMNNQVLTTQLQQSQAPESAEKINTSNNQKINAPSSYGGSDLNINKSNSFDDYVGDGLLYEGMEATKNKPAENVVPAIKPVQTETQPVVKTTEQVASEYETRGQDHSLQPDDNILNDRLTSDPMMNKSMGKMY